MSIASEITRLQEAKADIKTAIENKGVTVPAAATLDEYASLVDSISGGGGGDVTVEDKDVQYIDYDGTIVAQYDADEFLALTAHPSNPNHTSEGLLAQGWNWTLADAKTYVTNHGMLVIGQMYTTTDGATRIKIDLNLLPSLSLPLTVCVSQNVQRGTTLDWGDGSEIETFVGVNNISTLTHVYDTVGEYTLVISPQSGTSINFGVNTGNFIFTGNAITQPTAPYYVCVKSIQIGDNVNNVYGGMFYNCEYITMSSGVKLVYLNYLHKIKSLTLPDTTTGFYLRECFEMRSISLNSGPTALQANALDSCYNLLKLCIPDTVDTINNYAITNLIKIKRLSLSNSLSTIMNVQRPYELESLVIPDNMTTIGTYAFQNAQSLRKLVIGNGVTSIGQQCFENSIMLKEIVFGNSLTTIGTGVNTLNAIHSMETLTIPDTVTTIGGGAFRYGGCLKTLVIGSGVTTIGNAAFANYPVIESITIKATTPPTLGGANTFAATNNCPIYVPNGCLSAYQSATGWTAFASRMVESNS